MKCYPKKTVQMITCLLAIIIILAAPVRGQVDMEIDLVFKDVDLREVFHTLAELANVRLVTDGSVRGTVDLLRLDETTFQDALDAVLFANNLDYEIINDIYIIATPARIQELKKEEIVLETFLIEYGDAEDIRRMLGNLVPGANIEYDRRLDKLIIQATQTQIDRIAYLISILDVKVEEEIVEIEEPVIEDPVEEEEEIVEEKLFKTFRINYADISDIRSLLGSITPDAKFDYDNRLNLLLVEALESDMERITGLVRELDAPQDQISVEIRIEEVSSSGLEELGVAPGQLSQITVIKENGSFRGLNIDLPSILRVLNERGESTNLANPNLTTIDGKEARMLIGDRIPVKTQTVQDGQVVESISYIDVGILFQFTPRISNDGYITLHIKPEVSSIGEERTEGFPHIRTREVETNVRIKSGETFAIGGLLQKDETETMAGIPFLRELPILGEFFKRTRSEDRQTELIIFLTPKIIPAGQEL